MEWEIDRRQLAYAMIGFVIGYLAAEAAMMVWELWVVDYLIAERERVRFYVREEIQKSKPKLAD